MPRTRSALKRSGILKAASSVFARKPFHEVRTDEIAAEAGVGKGTLYRYFPTKDDLFYATLVDGFDEMDLVLEGLRAGDGAPAEALAACAKEAVRIFWARPSFAMVLHRDERRFRSRERELRRRRETLLRFVRETISRGAARGDFRAVDPRVAADLFLGMIRAVILYHGASDTPVALVKALTETFLGGIGRQREAS
jgi:AcrR family transcriptional regulator